jgi:hypothetical protein
MPRSRHEKKSPTAAPAEQRVLPMQLKVGDRIVDASGEYEVIGRPYTTNAGKDVHVRVQARRQPRRHRTPELRITWASMARSVRCTVAA